MLNHLHGCSHLFGNPSSPKQTPIYLSAPQLASAVLEGRFKEAKWSQTVAMALLHLSKRGHERIH